MLDFMQIDMARLGAIVMRIVSVETVNDAQAFAQKVREASEILIDAGLRIAGVAQGDARSLSNDSIVDAVVAAYEADIAHAA